MEAWEGVGWNLATQFLEVWRKIFRKSWVKSTEEENPLPVHLRQDKCTQINKPVTNWYKNRPNENLYL